MEQNPDFRVNNFDLLRLLAATEVIVDHYFQHLNKPVSAFGLKLFDLFPGVPVFFIISGYLISASYERNPDLKQYFRNRILRIYPGLWACIIFSVIVIAITGVSFLNKQAAVWFPAQLAGLIYTPGFLSNYGFGSYNGSLWSITVELQFYVLLPLCYKLVPKDKINYLLFGLLALFIACFVWYQVAYNDTGFFKLIGLSFIPHFYMFLIGVIFQRSQIYRSPLIYNKGLYWLVAYIALNLFFSSYIDPLVFQLHYITLLGFCLISLAYTAPRTAERLLHGNDISYGTYIYHGLILTVIMQEHWVKNVNLFEVMMITYALACLSWLFIEKRFIRMKKKTNKLTFDSTDKKSGHFMGFLKSKQLSPAPQTTKE
ncbi:MAG: acyltransferase [Bacteroidetes bacterium]|nr:acyltransferase [Bacteroidota bacterium]